MDVRSQGAIPLVAHAGYRYRQYLGSPATASDLFSSPTMGFGALRLFDDLVLEANSRASFQAHDGLETVAYILEGVCQVAHDKGLPIASLAPGVEVWFSPALARGVYISVIQGAIELNSKFVEEGSDAKVSLDSTAVHIQGVTAARVGPSRTCRSGSFRSWSCSRKPAFRRRRRALLRRRPSR